MPVCPICGEDVGPRGVECDACGVVVHAGRCGRGGWIGGEWSCYCLTHLTLIAPAGGEWG